MTYQTIQVHIKKSICTIRLNRPDAKNTINNKMIEECLDVLDGHNGCYNNEKFHILILEGLSKIFCLGADLTDLTIKKNDTIDITKIVKPEMLYKLWLQLATGPYISIAHIRGKVNAGGIGFVAACDIALAATNAEFSLSELLFDLFPACVLPFLINRIGFQKAHYMTLITRPITLQQAQAWHLVDAIEEDSNKLLHKHLLRLRHLSKDSIAHYKNYIHKINNILTQSYNTAITTNHLLFSNIANFKKIIRYQHTGLFPWET